MQPIRIVAIAVSLLVLLGLPLGTVQAVDNDQSTGVAIFLRIEGEQPENGEIIVLDGNSYRLSNKPYDTEIAGIHVQTPAVGVNYVPDEAVKAVIASGVVAVRVSGENGAIKAGDPITTSTRPGIGMKATQPGFIVGTARRDYNPKKPTDTALVPVSISIVRANVFSQGSVFSAFREMLAVSASAGYQSPSTVLKYLIASFILVLGFLIGFIIFGRVATNGITSLGRNPLASRVIGVGIAFNVFMTTVIIVGGVVVAYFILKL